MSILTNVNSYYREHYPNDSILIFSPGRINIIGEHTDYNEGFVFPAAIDKGIYASIGKSSTMKSTAHALDLNESYSFSTTELTSENPGSWKNYIYGVIAEIQKTGRELQNFNLVFSGDIPNGSGLSSSAALENSVVFGLNTLFKLGFTKEEMIFISQKAEHNYVGVKCGIMDQYASMFGQENKALLLDCRTITAQPVQIDFKDYGLLLINTNVKHNLSNSAYNDRRNVCEKVAGILGVKALRDATEKDLFSIKSKLKEEDYQKALYVIQENNRVIAASQAIQQNDIHKLGELLFETHNGLKEQYQVSCDELDFLVDRAKNASAVIGARMMGGGFGGCTLNIILKDHKDEFMTKTAEVYKNQFGRACSFYNVTIVDGTHNIIPE